MYMPLGFDTPQYRAEVLKEKSATKPDTVRTEADSRIYEGYAEGTFNICVPAEALWAGGAEDIGDG